MGEVEILQEGFRFDLWANERWLEYLDSKEGLDQDRAIFQHLLGAQEVWLRRCHGESVTEFPQPALKIEKLRELNSYWIEVLERAEGEPVFHYNNLSGQPFTDRLSRIARHVIDHGTYHRGELRGLCLARNDDDFPETGLIAFYRLES